MPAAIQWTPELEDAICAATATTPKGLEHICAANPEFPKSSAIYEHRAESEAFAEKYTRAKANQCVLLADQIIDIADDSSRDLTEVEITEGVTVNQLDREHIERVKIRIDSRKWLAGKLAPKIFGDRIEHSGQVGIRTIVVEPDVKPDSSRPALKPEFESKDGLNED